MTRKTSPALPIALADTADVLATKRRNYHSQGWRKRLLKPRKTERDRTNTKISVRLTPDELIVISELAEEQKLTPAAFLRSLAIAASVGSLNTVFTSKG